MLGQNRKTMLFLASCSVSLAALWIASCVSEEETKNDPVLKPEEKLVLDEYKAEVEVGRNMAGRLLQYYGTVGNANLLAYVDSVLGYVGKSSEFNQSRFMVEIVDSDSVNAFACPGGYIIITAGAIRHAKNEAELAHVLAHEIVHVGKKHMFNTIKKMNVEEIEANNKLATERKIDEVVATRKRPDPEEESAFASELVKYLSGGNIGMGIIKAAGAGMALMMEKGLGAEKEYEADFHGVRYAINAGYDPQALTQFLCRLKYPSDKKGTCAIPKEDLLKVQEEKVKAEQAAKVSPAPSVAPGASPSQNVNAPENAAPAVAENKPTGKPQTVLDKTHPPVAARAINIAQSLAEVKAQNIVGAKGFKRFQGFRKLVEKK